MPENRKIVRVFLASPGDLSEEREAAKAAVDEFNQTWSAELGYQIELVGWELTVSRFGRPQALINRELDTCELFLGMVWKRWGTPPDRTAGYTSGFEEEFERSIARKRHSGLPEMSLYFKNVDEELLRDPGDDLKKVLSFKAGIIESKEILFEQFENAVELQSHIRRSISDYVKSIKKAETSELSVGEQAKPESSISLPAEATSDSSESPMSPAISVFISQFVGQATRPYGEGTMDAVDVARFRLIAASVQDHGNDSQYLGAHDANIIFAKRDSVNFTSQEYASLLNSGLASYSDENKPIWCWYSAIGSSQLYIRSVFGGAQEIKIGALRAMAEIAEPLPTGAESRTFYISDWFSDDAPASVKVAAISYLATCGTSADVEVVEKEFARHDYSTRSEALRAIVAIKLREGRANAFDTFLRLAPESVDDATVRELFATTAGVATDRLELALQQPSAAVRVAAARVLEERGELCTFVATELLRDANRDMRLIGMRVLTRAGRTFTDGEARSLLVASQAKNLFSSWRTDGADEARYDAFKKWLWSRLPDAELIELTGVFNREAEIVLAERRFSRLGDSLRSDVKDRYRAKFESAVRDLYTKYGEGAKVALDLESLSDFIRKRDTRRALDVISRKGGPYDLPILREAISDSYVGFSYFDMSFLKRFGEWCDIPLVIKAADESHLATSLSVLSGDREKSDIAGRTICALAKGREDDLLELPMSENLKSWVLANMSEQAVRRTSDAALIKLFGNSSSEVRKVAALQSIYRLSKRRITSLLTRYEGGSYRYYNVLRWLDLGVSISRERAADAAGRALRRGWPQSQH